MGSNKHWEKQKQEVEIYRKKEVEIYRTNYLQTIILPLPHTVVIAQK